MKKIFALMALCGLAVLMAGCYTTVEGQTRAGTPFRKDTIEGRYERPIAQVHPAAKKVLEFNGTLRRDDTVMRLLEARIDTRYVWVRLTELEPNLTQVVVQARSKSGEPDIDLAAEIEKQIALQIAQSK